MSVDFNRIITIIIPMLTIFKQMGITNGFQF